MQNQQVGISNTEVQQAYKCQLAWLYGYHPESLLELKESGPARLRGILGHKILETFYRLLMNGFDYDAASTLAMDEIQATSVEAIAAHDVKKLDMLNWLRKVLPAYFEHYYPDIQNWEILEVEAFHAMEWANEDDFYLPSRLDVTIYHKAGNFKGETSPLDHKFTNDFWKWPKVKMNAQLPLQIRALRESRFSGKRPPIVKRAIINQIRTRSMKDPGPEDLFKREFPEYDSARINSVFENHLKTAVTLARFKRIPYEEAREEVTAALGSPSCDFCDFREICDIEFDGGSKSNTLLALYRKKGDGDYGYPPLEEIRNER